MHFALWTQIPNFVLQEITDSCERVLIVLFQSNIPPIRIFRLLCKYAPDYLYSIYICDLSPLRFAVVERIAVRFPFISRSNGLGIRSNSPGYLFKKIVIHSNGSGYPFEPFERLVSCATAPKQFHPSSSRRICQKMYITLPIVVYHQFMNCHATFSAQSIFEL